MKKFTSLFLVIVLMLGCVMMSAGTASAANEADYEYKTLSPSTAEITSYKGSGGDIIIPRALDGYSVVSIGDKAFYQNKLIQKVTIPGTVTQIGSKAFAGSYITAVSMNKSVTKLGSSAFSECVYLTDVELSPNIETIGNSCFYMCTRLDSIVIPEGVKALGDGAFMSCNHLSEATIPSSMRIIGEYAFAYTALKSIHVPLGVEEVKAFAFFQCYSMESATIAGSVISIGDNAFRDNAALTYVGLSEGLTTIGTSAFESTGLKKLRIPTTVNSIGEYAFGYYFDNKNFDYAIDMEFTAEVAKDSAAQEYAIDNRILYELYSTVPETTAPTEPVTTVPSTTAPTVPATSDATEPVTTVPVTSGATEVPTSTSNGATNPTIPANPLGDADLDSKITVKDATAIQKHVALLVMLSDEALDVSDCDFDTIITVKDATAIQKLVAKLITEF